MRLATSNATTHAKEIHENSNKLTYDNTKKHVKYTIDMTKKDVYVGESGMQRQKLVPHAKDIHENFKSDL